MCFKERVQEVVTLFSISKEHFDLNQREHHMTHLCTLVEKDSYISLN